MNRVEAYVKFVSKALVGVHLHGWIATYPVDKVIRSLNNWGLDIICVLTSQFKDSG